jgi:hypothetical protein
MTAQNLSDCFEMARKGTPLGYAYKLCRENQSQIMRGDFSQAVIAAPTRVRGTLLDALA